MSETTPGSGARPSTTKATLGLTGLTVNAMALIAGAAMWFGIVAFKEHHSFNTFKHVFVPSFGLAANCVCMLFYLVGPWMVPGMNKTEPYVALGVVAAWGIYGRVYFKRRSAKLGRPVFLTERSATAS